MLITKCSTRTHQTKMVYMANNIPAKHQQVSKQQHCGHGHLPQSTTVPKHSITELLAWHNLVSISNKCLIYLKGSFRLRLFFFQQWYINDLRVRGLSLLKMYICVSWGIWPSPAKRLNPKLLLLSISVRSSIGNIIGALVRKHSFAADEQVGSLQGILWH